MSTKISAERILSDSTGIEKVWVKNPEMTLGNNDDTVTLKNYQGAIKTVKDHNDRIADLRDELDGLLDNRDDAARVLRGYNTRAFSGIRANFGPDSAEYEQAGGTRSSERKKAVRKAKTQAS